MKGVALRAADGAMPAIGDPGHVETILANLVSNAIAATPAGGSVTPDPGRAARARWASR